MPKTSTMLTIEWMSISGWAKEDDTRREKNISFCHIGSKMGGHC